jgi:hypothetical protein
LEVDVSTDAELVDAADLSYRPAGDGPTRIDLRFP